jgi:hypothetical protein
MAKLVAARVVMDIRTCSLKGKIFGRRELPSRFLFSIGNRFELSLTLGKLLKRGRRKWRSGRDCQVDDGGFGGESDGGQAVWQRVFQVAALHAALIADWLCGLVVYQFEADTLPTDFT